jgi:general stress protein CsbA
MPEETTTTTTVTPMPEDAIVRTTVVTPARTWQQDLYDRFTSRKFIAYLISVLTAASGYLGSTLDGREATAAVIAATIGYLLAEAMVDRSRAGHGD